MSFLRKTKHHLKHALYDFLIAGEYHYTILSFDVIINYNSQILLCTRLKALLVGDGEVIVVLHNVQQSFSRITTVAVCCIRRN